MNQTLSDLRLSVFNDVNHLQKYETCRQQSKCYLLAPPPRPPTIPELFLTNACHLSSSSSPSVLTNIRSRVDPSPNLTMISIILGLLIAMTSTCLILVLLGARFQFHQKLRCRRRRTTDLSSVNSSIREANNSDVTFIKTTTTTGGDSGDGSASFSNVPPMSYDCLTPLTSMTMIRNGYPSLRINEQSNSSLSIAASRQRLQVDDNSLSRRDSINIYEEIRPPMDRHQCCCCCSCTMNHYQQQQQLLQSSRQLTPHYYTCEPANQSNPSTIVCQSCLLETLHRKQQTNSSSMNCACRHFFVPIK